MRSEWTGLEHTIREGCRWLQAGGQPKGAIIHHSGPAYNHVGGGLRVSFSPWGRFTHAPGPNVISWGHRGERPVRRNEKTTATVIFHLALTDDQYRADWPPIPPFTQEEVDEFVEMVRATGIPIVDHWNGAGFDSFSIKVGNVANSLLRASSDYMDGCPEHNSVFCSSEGCDWYGRGHDKLVPPSFIAVPYDEPAENPETKREDDNLRVIKEALEKIKPVVGDLGFVASMFAAGRRGHIDEVSSDRLEFVDDGGNGVLMPAEVAESLVAMAIAAYEAGVLQ